MRKYFYRYFKALAGPGKLTSFDVVFLTALHFLTFIPLALTIATSGLLAGLIVVGVAAVGILVVAFSRWVASYGRES